MLLQGRDKQMRNVMKIIIRKLSGRGDREEMEVEGKNTKEKRQNKRLRRSRRSGLEAGGGGRV